MYTGPMFTSHNNDVDEFWKEFEETTGETVLAKSLGKYLSGQDGRADPLLGLAVATSGGFRFRHFPREPSIFGIARLSPGSKPPKDHSFFIPRETIVSVELVRESRWWKKLLSSPSPLLVIGFQADDAEKTVTVEIHHDGVAGALKELCPCA